jgi:uncharacterized protein (DUF952 family)/GNAT superfamily N-acetyltransferase
MNPDVLLHLTTGVEWRAALAAGSVAPPSLVTDGFVHLSLPEQVALPANRIFAGRTDLLLLVVDPDRIPLDELRFEPGVPSDPASTRFPHLYAPLPVAAVTSVVPYCPDAAGRFDTPSDFPMPNDAVGRALRFDRSLAQRRAAAVVPVTQGFAVLDPRVASSYEHNTLWMAGAPDAATIRSDSDRVLAGLGHRRVMLDAPPPDDLGWEIDEFRLLVRDASVPIPTVAELAVEAVELEVVASLWDTMWRLQLPGVSDDVVEQLVRREGIANAHCAVTDLVVRDPHDGHPVAGTQLRIDGATAAIEAVLTRPDWRHRRCATAVVTEAIRRATAAGCDVVFLAALADDWPRSWYERLGFREVGARWEATLTSV